MGQQVIFLGSALWLSSMIQMLSASLILIIFKLCKQRKTVRQTDRQIEKQRRRETDHDIVSLHLSLLLCQLLTLHLQTASHQHTNDNVSHCLSAFSALTLWAWRQEEHTARKKLEWWGAGMVICVERGANDLHMVQLMPVPPYHFCFRKTQNCLSFW